MDTKANEVVARLKDEPSIKQIASACESVWQDIAFDIPEDSVSATDMVELATDASRLEMSGFKEEHKAFQKLVKEEGYNAARQAIVSVLPYSAYEAGGSQL